MTDREAIDKMIEHFSKPGAVYGVETLAEYGDSPSCVYRLDYDAASEVRCSVGVLIPDDEYCILFEGVTVDSIHVPSLSGVNLKTLYTIQKQHDALALAHAPVETFVNYLKDIRGEEI